MAGSTLVVLGFAVATPTPEPIILITPTVIPALLVADRWGAPERDYAELVAIFENLGPMASPAEKELAAARYLGTKSVDCG